MQALVEQLAKGSRRRDEREKQRQRVREKRREETKRTETDKEDERQTKVQAKQTRYDDGRSAQAHKMPTNQTTRIERREEKKSEGPSEGHEPRFGGTVGKGGQPGKQVWNYWNQAIDMPTTNQRRECFFLVASNGYRTTSRGAFLCGASQSERRQSTRERHGGRGGDSAASSSGARPRKARTAKRQRDPLCLLPATTSSGRSGCTTSFSFCFSRPHGSTRVNESNAKDGRSIVICYSVMGAAGRGRACGWVPIWIWTCRLAAIEADWSTSPFIHHVCWSSSKSERQASYAHVGGWRSGRDRHQALASFNKLLPPRHQPQS
ncbi:uncharacterized protein J3D65DRAFT_383470 [Phyllosticta citribraziliensis]|uniref:Uncharacterized protein n=1 Tax=Phyllosticta citribraziliensis TaxID=989973 RepID=A0ABR1LQL2_9PEZI